MPLTDLLPGAAAQLPIAMAAASPPITAPLEVAHFLAQAAHESMGFRALVEDLRYSATRLQRLWPNRFSAADALNYAYQAERIANRAYCNRLGNGPEKSGDGWRYRGRGWFQITGRENYAAASLRLYGNNRLELDPDMVATPAIAAATACDYWNSRHLGIHAQQDDLVSVTRGINGGTTGLDDRKVWLIRFKSQLGIA